MRNKRVMALILAGVFVFQTSLGSVNATQQDTNTETTEYIVQVKDEEALEEVMEENKSDVVEESNVEELEEQQMTVLELTEKEAEELSAEKDVVVIEENIILEASETVSTEENIGNDKIKVALIDSGVSFDEDVPIADRISIIDGMEVDNVLFDDATGHGTGLSGVIGAQDNGSGIRGIDPNAEIYSIQILNENNQTTLSNLIAAIYKAIELDCKIINLSLGTSVDSEMLHTAVRDAYDAGILIVAAAGNTKGKEVQYPAAYEEVLAVGSTDTTGNKVADTCDGVEIAIFAPGSQVPTTGLFGGISVVEGTSVATAQVTGAASLVWSIDSNKSAGFIKSLLTNTAQVVEDNGKSDAGLLDIRNALEQYDELSKIYVEEKCEYTSIQKDNVATEEFTDVELVNGLWGGERHEVLVENATSSYSIKNEYVQVMAITANWADDEQFKGASYLHGSHNYVKGLKFLYQCAGYVRSGEPVEIAIEQAASDAKFSTSNKNDREMMEATKELLYNFTIKGVDNGSNAIRYYKVLGFAMHLVGDVYAHRTIVPTYTVTGTITSAYKPSTNSTSYDAKFGKSTFKNSTSHQHDDSILKTWAKKSDDNKSVICDQWNCLVRTVKMGRLEFRDTFHYMKDGKHGTYEDNIKFCQERYADAKAKCKVLFQESYGKEEFDGVEILRPTKKHVKLNAFKKFAQNAGEDISSVTSEKWKEISTSGEY